MRLLALVAIATWTTSGAAHAATVIGGFEAERHEGATRSFLRLETEQTLGRVHVSTVIPVLIDDTSLIDESQGIGNIEFNVYYDVCGSCIGLWSLSFGVETAFAAFEESAGTKEFKYAPLLLTKREFYDFSVDLSLGAIVVVPESAKEDKASTPFMTLLWSLTQGRWTSSMEINADFPEESETELLVTPGLEYTFNMNGNPVTAGLFLSQAITVSPSDDKVLFQLMMAN